MSKLNISLDELRRFAADALTRAGLAPAHARIAAEPLVYADKKGFDTHGIANLGRIYVAKLRSGRIRGDAEPRILKDEGATALIDGQDGLGLVTGVKAMRLAMDKAAAYGVGAVAVRRSSHFGPAGYYAELALERGMVGIAMSNLGSQTIARPPHGGAKIVGTNPICLAAPGGEMPAFVLDMSTTVVSTGRVRAAARLGERIPEGWLVDEHGAPVTDPASYDAGTGHLQLLGGQPETGGWKGLGLALWVDILCGALAGAAAGPDPDLFGPSGEARSRDDRDVGHFFLALDIRRFGELSEFQRRMDRILAGVVECPANGPGRRVTYPGYLEHERRRALRVDAVSVDSDLLAALGGLARELGIKPLETLVEEGDAA
ncbi:Ldh family oxidoreductase [Sorangium sp. So ce185]|uniref:Ldh family oxidoreductase n=1 Tax=Sorangium sp. So ce185 TaxID=3133287 RepID=UPI003F5E84C5